MFEAVLVNCQSLPRFEHDPRVLTNNSYIYYASISNGDGALKCVTDSDNCCTDSDVGSWTDGIGRAVQQGADELVCTSLEDMERSVSTATVAAFQTHQDCGDVMYLTPVM